MEAVAQPHKPSAASAGPGAAKAPGARRSSNPPALERRRFLTYAAAGVLGGLGTMIPAQAASAQPRMPASEAPQALAMTPQATPREPKFFSGADLTGWDSSVGDGVWTAENERPVGLADIEMNHHGLSSELRANILERGVMAHTIGFKRLVDDDALTHSHLASYDFRLPYLPGMGNVEENAQTIEGGLFVWDGKKTRRDVGLAFQWVLNPWQSNFGELLAWSQQDGGSWISAGHLTPDTGWHRIHLELNPRDASASIRVDDMIVPAELVSEEKSSSWEARSIARLQAEVVSMFPGARPSAPAHRAEFRDWEWSWIPQV